MTLNRHEFDAIEKMAKDMGVRFRFDGAISPCLNGDQAPVRLRVPPAEVVAKEMADEDRLEKWCHFFARQGATARSEMLYQCGAGVTAFNIDPNGWLKPCLMVVEPSCDLTRSSFRVGWEAVIPRLHQRKASAHFVCNACEKRALCGYCPAFFAAENGAEDVRSDYLCRMGHCRSRAIKGDTASPKQGNENDDHQSVSVDETAIREAEAPRH
jgi:radical SAM protein with 4Fe4S-binding SPASM domain